MTRKFKLTLQAKKDLRGIWRYTYREWGEQQAHTYLQNFNNRFEWLADKPKMGKHRPDIKNGYFCFPQGRHLIFYRLQSEYIEIIGIPHKSMDIQNFFDE